MRSKESDKQAAIRKLQHDLITSHTFALTTMRSSVLTFVRQNSNNKMHPTNQHQINWLILLHHSQLHSHNQSTMNPLMNLQK